MRKVKVYIAMSLDGFIASNDGGVDWLKGDGSDPNNMGSYPHFISEVDTVILGYKTYEQITTQLAKDNWPYAEQTTYVITSKNLVDTNNIKFSNDLINLITNLKQEEGKTIWICGGASIVRQLLNSHLVDELCVSIIPTVLGSGISLFKELETNLNLHLISSENYNGITDLNYRVDK